MHAFIIISKSASNLQSLISKIALEQKAKIIPFSLQKIEDVRNLKKIVKFSFSEKTAIVINDIDKITPEASNAFLKNLEEPTKNVIYILTASNLNNVLPTVVSRCQVIRTQDNQKISSNDKDIINRKKNINYEDALNIKDRGEAIKFVEDLIYLDHQNNVFKNMENYLYTINNLKLNGNVALQMTNLVARMNSVLVSSS